MLVTRKLWSVFVRFRFATLIVLVFYPQWSLLAAGSLCNGCSEKHLAVLVNL
jgi:hypothetical protein